MKECKLDLPQEEEFDFFDEVKRTEVLPLSAIHICFKSGAQEDFNYDYKVNDFLSIWNSTKDGKVKVLTSSNEVVIITVSEVAFLRVKSLY